MLNIPLLLSTIIPGTLRRIKNIFKTLSLCVAPKMTLTAERDARAGNGDTPPHVNAAGNTADQQGSRPMRCSAEPAGSGGRNEFRSARSGGMKF